MNIENTRKPFLLLAAFLLTGCVSLEAAARKNVLFIVADDLNCYLGAYGHGQAKTPDMDRLARQGTLFRAAMCQFPVCGPSRASFMTGRRPNTTGILSNGPSLFEKDLDVPTIASVFKEHGYRTARSGKIYNSVDNRRPLDWDELLDAPLSKESRQRSRGGAGEVVDGGHKHWRAEWRAPDCRDEDLPDGADTEAVVEWIGRNAETPFFLAVGFRKPHQPLVVPKRYFDVYDRDELPRAWERYRGEEIPTAARNTSGRNVEAAMTDEQRAGYTLAYHATVSYIDAQVGKLMEALEANDLADRTVVVLFGDNGFHVGEHRTWGKNTLFESSARVPLIIADPAGRKGQTCDDVVELIDLFPTLLESCGLDGVPGLEGRSLAPLLAGSAAPPRAGYTQVANGWSIRSPQWRLMSVDPKKPELLLYDLSQDPHELTNLAGKPEHAGLVQDLSEKAHVVHLP